MKIKTKNMPLEQVMALPCPKHKLPRMQSPFFRWLINAISADELKKVHFKCKKENMDALDPKEPCLYLMNHSCFLDLKIAFSLISPKPFHIVCTADGFVGKEGLMRAIGCIPTYKFITDVGMVRDLFYVTKELKSSVLMYPEASYSFDGTATPLPEGFAKFIKKLGIPVVMIKTEGAFLHDPLYNNLQLRETKVTATMKCLWTREELAITDVDRMDEVLKEEFTFDHFRTQQMKEVRITESFRTDGLERVLYKCPNCREEGKTIGKGVFLTCTACGKEYTLTEYGVMIAMNNRTEFTHIPDWYRWERECVRTEIEQGSYSLNIPVNIGIMKDMKAIYMVGKGRLQQTEEGFVLTGCDGQLEYHQKPSCSYSLYSDYYWYEIGDVICIGNGKILYYCFPIEKYPVAKARLATEEIYISKYNRTGNRVDR